MLKKILLLISLALLLTFYIGCDDDADTPPGPTWIDNPDDTENPLVAFVDPLDNDTIPRDTFMITVSATDDYGIWSVQLYIDDAFKAELNTLPYQYSWDVISQAASGTHHHLCATAYDSTGKYTEACVDIVIE